MGLATYATRRAVERPNSSLLLVKATTVAAMCLQVLVVGAFWGSWIGLSRSIDTLTPATFLEVGHVMMEDYGPIMSVLMPATVLLTLLAGLFVYWRHPTAGLLVLAGFVCFAVATATTLLVNVPIDEMMAGWSLATLPTNWMQIRDQWETFHTLRTFVTLAGFAATVAGVLLPSDSGTRSPHS
jgi:uncharacterized membrane protein